MSPHNNITIVPSDENSWGITDTYHIKCICCGKILCEDVAPGEIKKCIEIIHPIVVEKSSNF